MERYIDLDDAIERTLQDPVGAVLAESNNLIGFLECLPIADVMPVVHAHWIKSETEPYKCSACKRSELWMNAVTYEYCPHCGAKMDELEELNMLERYLIDHDIPYERKDSDGDSDGMFAEWHQVCVPVSDPREKAWDAVCHPGSYGYEEGKLEIMGTIVPPTAGDIVLGNLTADEVIKLIEVVQ